MHIRAFGLSATIVLRDEFLSCKVLHDAKSMGTAGFRGQSFAKTCLTSLQEKKINVFGEAMI
jgi:hypothetical protein